MSDDLNITGATPGTTPTGTSAGIDINANTGNDRISAFVNRVDPFEFEFDGFKVSGEFYKYRTTTPRYQLAHLKRRDEINQRIDGIEDEIKGITDADEREAKRKELEDKYEAQLKEYAFQYFKDTIKRWQDQDGNEIVLTIDTFQDLPEPFTTALSAHFKKLREEAVNPTKSGSSQSG